MNSLGFWIVLLLPLVAGVLVLLGSSLRWIVDSLLARRWDQAFHGEGPVEERLIFDLALGTAAIPVLFLFANVAGVPFVYPLAYLLLAFLAVTSLARVYFVRRELVRKARDTLRSRRIELAVLLGALVLSVSLRVAPYWDAYVYAGDDIRAYSLLAESILTQGRLPTSWGFAALPSWSSGTDYHLAFTGSEAVFAFFGTWVPLDLPQLASAITLIFSSLFFAAIFLCARRLLPGLPREGVLVASVIGAISPYPLLFDEWGAIDETMGWVVLLAALTVLATVPRSRSLAGRDIVAGAVLLAGLVLISPIDGVFAVLFLGCFLISRIVVRAGIRTALKVLAAQVVGAAILIAPLAVFVARIAFGGVSAGPDSAGVAAFQAYPIFQPGNLSDSLFRLITLLTLTWTLVPLVLLGLFGFVVLVVVRRTTPGVLALALWAGALFLLNENGPNGLFLLHYPEWNFVFPDRPANLLFVPVSIGAGFLVGSLLVRSRVPRAAAIAPQLPSRRRWVLRRSAQAGVVVALVLCLVSVNGLFEDNAARVANGTSLTLNDVAAFDWIDSHVPSGSTIVVNWGDSGTWLPEFAHDRVFPYYEVTSNASVLTAYNVMIAGLLASAAPNFTAYSSLGADYNFSYAFLGARPQFYEAGPLYGSNFEDPPSAGSYVLRMSPGVTEAANGTVALSGSGENVTLRGPLALALTVAQGGTVSVRTLAVPVGMDLRYTLEPSSGSPAQAWLAVEPLGSLVFSSGGSLVFQLNPGFFSPACSTEGASAVCF